MRIYQILNYTKQTNRRIPLPVLEAMEKEWFAGWFDSPYYHLLYGYRDEREAEAFVQLLAKGPLENREIIVDLGCGKGRHARALAAFGKQVHGMDLSPESITYANGLKTSGAYFSVQDMRRFQVKEPVDAILNLFTSFGYFDTLEEHIQVLDCVHRGLREGGLFVLDYFNAQLVQEGEGQFSPADHPSVQFHWTKRIANDSVYKDIQVRDGEATYHFQERVRLFQADELGSRIESAHMKVQSIYGDYALGEFIPSSSPRCIIFAQRV